MSEQKNTVVICGPVVINYPALFKARKQLNNDKTKYEVDILISKKDHKELIQEIREAMKTAYIVAKDSKFKGKKPDQMPKFFWPMRDGDKEDKGPEYKGHYFIKAKSDGPPGVVDRNRKPIINESEIYSGAVCYVSINFYAYNEGGGVGIAAGLNNVLKMKDGKRLSGRPDAASEFANLDIEADGSDEDFNFDADDDEVYDFS